LPAPRPEIAWPEVYDEGSVQRAYLFSTRVLSGLLILVGVAMVASALARGGGVLAVGVLLGTMLALLGAGRLLLGRTRER
jgi:hypothetical protein